MVIQSATTRVIVLSTHTQASPLSVPLSSAGPGRIRNFGVTNVGITLFSVRVKAGSNSSSYVVVEPGQVAALSCEGAADIDAVSLEFARPGAQPRYISMDPADPIGDIPANAEVTINQ